MSDHVQPAGRKQRRYEIIPAPSILGLKPTGVDGLAGRLLAEGLAESIGAAVGERIDVPEYDPQVDPVTRTLNPSAIASWSPRLADRVEAVLDRDGFPLILGGDCSILLGSMLAFRRRGRYGLLFIDGHADFYQPAANPNGEAASMELAFATGRGPALLTDLEGRRPLLRDQDTVVIGFRDGDEQASYGSQPLPERMLAFDLAAIRHMGIEQAGGAAIERLSAEALDGFFIHFDADCLDDAIMPAVDYRLAGGLSWEEMVFLLRLALDSGRAVGMEVTIYNPALDKDGEAGRRLAKALARALEEAS